MTGGTAEPLLPVLLGSAVLGAIACRRLSLDRCLGSGALCARQLAARNRRCRSHCAPRRPGLGTGLAIAGERDRCEGSDALCQGCGILVYALFASLLFASTALARSLCRRTDGHGLGRGEYASAASRFLVITGDRWGDDRSAEWFPALTGRVSVNTVQGYEWAGGSQFARRVAASQELRACAAEDTNLSRHLDARVRRSSQLTSMWPNGV